MTNLFRFDEMQTKVQAASDGEHDIPYEEPQRDRHPRPASPTAV